MNVLSSLGILMIGTLAVVTGQQDTWYNGLNSDADNMNVNCQVAAGHSDCLAQHSDVVTASNKQTRCPALVIFVTCIQSECANSNSFATTIDAIDAYCNTSPVMTGGVLLTCLMMVLAFLAKQN